MVVFRPEIVMITFAPLPLLFLLPSLSTALNAAPLNHEFDILIYRDETLGGPEKDCYRFSVPTRCINFAT